MRGSTSTAVHSGDSRPLSTGPIPQPITEDTLPTAMAMADSGTKSGGLFITVICLSIALLIAVIAIILLLFSRWDTTGSITTDVPPPVDNAATSLISGL